MGAYWLMSQLMALLGGGVLEPAPTLLPKEYGLYCRVVGGIQVIGFGTFNIKA